MAVWWRELLTPEAILWAVSKPRCISIEIRSSRKPSMTLFSTRTSNRDCEQSNTKQLVITGVATHLCCESTARSAFMRGFAVFIAIDGTATLNRELHFASLNGLAHGCAVPLLTGRFDRCHSGAFMMIPVAIIGAGPAGIAAAIQLQRSGIEFLLLEKNRIGGLLNEANLVENFPGIAGGVPGKTLAARLRRQLSVRPASKSKKRKCLRLGYHDGCFMIQTEKQIITAGKVILACGTQPISSRGRPWTNCSFKSELFNSVLPLLETKQKTIAIIGGGDAALDYALNLARKNKVHILNRSGNPRALPLLLDRCRHHPRRSLIHEKFQADQALWPSAGNGMKSF